MSLAARFARTLCCLSVGLGLLVLLAGCGGGPQPKKPIDTKPQVALVKPARRNLERTIGQPGYVLAYEQTSLYPKVSGFIKKWDVDIGDRIKKGQPICELFVPDLTAELSQKKAVVAEQEVNIRLAEQLVNVAEHYRSAAAAQVKEAQANVRKYAASVERWQSEVGRLTGLYADRVIDQQILTETRKQLQADTASWEAAQASVTGAEATERARVADVAKTKVDVEATRAKLVVQQADEQRLAALVSYTFITAPYDGIVVVRNANTGDYVEPGIGDLSATQTSWDQSLNRGAPLYVVARTDFVRVWVDVPENEASYVGVGSPANITFTGLASEEIDSKVTRTSWALNERSRTLRAEIDLPNRDMRLLPGTYAYGRVLIKRPNVWTVPLECVMPEGNQNVCFLYKGGKAMKTPVQSGLNDGKWIELVATQENGKWVQLTGSEEVIQGDLPVLSNGQEVHLSKTPSREQQPE